MNKKRIALFAITVILESFIVTYSFGWGLFVAVLYGVLPSAMIANGFIGYFLKKGKSQEKKTDILPILFPILLLLLGEIIFLITTMDFSNGNLQFTFGMDSVGHYSLAEAIMLSLPFFLIVTATLSAPLWIGYGIIGNLVLKKKMNIQAGMPQDNYAEEQMLQSTYKTKTTQVQIEEGLTMLVSEKNKTFFLILALFPVTGILGLYVLLLNEDNKKKVISIIWRVILLSIALIIHLCGVSKVVIPGGAVLAFDNFLVLVLELLYICAIIEAFVFIKQPKK